MLYKHIYIPDPAMQIPKKEPAIWAFLFGGVYISPILRVILEEPETRLVLQCKPEGAAEEGV
jgi:hypothetical protein